jgi:hypothetical protein
MNAAGWFVGGCLALVCLRAPAEEPAPTELLTPAAAACPVRPCPPIVPPCQPGQPQPGQEPTAPAPDVFAQAPEGGTSPVASYNPAMFGDIFGSRGLPLIIPGRTGTPAVSQTLGGRFAVAGFPAVPATFLTPIVVNDSGVPLQFNPLLYTLFNSQGAILPGLNTIYLPSANFTHASSGVVVVPPSSVLPVGTKVSLQNQPLVTANVNSEAMTRVGPGGTLTLLSSTASLINQSGPLSGTSAWNIETFYNYFIPGTPGTPALVLNAPSPSAGGIVGRTKVSDDNGVLPADRFIFDYDFFNTVPLTPQGNNVHRFSPGFEKTFFDQRASIEVRLPFASTISTDIVADGITNDGRGAFGDVHLTLKGLLYGDPVLNVAGGLGIDIPTADAITVSLVDGTRVARINNDAWVLTPYFAFLLTPNDRLFFQNWYEFGFSTNGNSVQANPDFTGPRRVGTLTDQALLQIDAQLGYWLYRNDASSSLLRGLAPFVELHYNSTMGKADSIQAGGFVLGDPNSHFDELNLSAGFALHLGDNLNLYVGAVAPLKGHQDRSFDWQAGIHGNWVFGPSSRTRAAAPSSF